MNQLQVDFMQVECNQAMSCSIVSPTINTMEITAIFRSKADFGGLIYSSEDVKQHKRVAYPTKKEYSNTKVSFQLETKGNIVSFSDVKRKPSLTITANGKEYYATLGFCGVKKNTVITRDWTGERSLGHNFVAWDSEFVTWTKEEIEYIDIFDENGNYIRTDEKKVMRFGTASRPSDYEIDYVEGKIMPVEGSSIPYGASLSISYSYHSDSVYEIDFGKLKQGEHPNQLKKIPSDHIEKILFPIMPTNYSINDMIHTGKSETATLKFINWKVVGGELGKEPSDMRSHGYRFAEGYDDEYYRNPKRIIDTMHLLGYRKKFDFYLGASHYYNFIGEKGSQAGDFTKQSMITDQETGCNEAFKQWYIYLCKEAVKKGFGEIVISISMESLHVPEEWRQKMYNEVAGATGWQPPTYFYSPTNPKVREWYKKVCTELISIAFQEGIKPSLQLGEPWWWWQEFEPGNVSTPFPNRPPCFYDDYTIKKYYEELGEGIPIFHSSEIDVTKHEKTLKWLQKQLGEFSDYIKEIAYEHNIEYGILFFPPSILDIKRVPEAIRIVNVPMRQWKYPQLDFIQIEDYDWLIQENEGHSSIYSFAKEYFGYPKSKIDYFSGFAWNQYKVTQLGEKKESTVSTEFGQVEVNAGHGSSILVQFTLNNKLF